MDLGIGRGYALQQDTLPITFIRKAKPAERSWRMQQELLAFETAEQASAQLSKKDKQSKLLGLALCMRHKFNSVGYGTYPRDMTPLLNEANFKLRSDPACFTRVTRGNGREAVACSMKPGEYILLQAAETMVLWTGLKLADAGKLPEFPDVASHERDVLERIYICLLRLSGNMSSTVRDHQGQLSEAARSHTVSLIDVGNGESAPADLIIATQLNQGFQLHPKQLAWVLNELKFDTAKTRAINKLHGPSVKAMQQAADAMMVLASNPAAMPQHPDTDLTTAAAAVAAGGSAHTTAANASSSSSSAAEGASFLPAAGTISDDAALQLMRGQPVSALKKLLQSYGVNYKHCVEKEDIVNLALQTYKTNPAPKPASSVISGGPEPCDLSKWRQMALFLRGEALEAAENRTPAVVAAFKAAVAASQENDDELYGCLSAWNAVRVITNGPDNWRIGDVLQLMDYAAACEVKLKGWNGYLLIQPRIMILKKPMRDAIKDAVAAAHRLSFKRVPGSFRYGDIRSAKVRELIKPGDEDYEVPINPALASIRTGTVTAELAGKQCAGCKLYFHSVMQCSGCKSVEYCSKDCQRTHWKAQHKKDCETMKAEKAAKVHSR